MQQAGDENGGGANPAAISNGLRLEHTTELAKI